MTPNERRPARPSGGRESFRTALVDSLLHKYGFPAAWVGTRIVFPEKSPTLSCPPGFFGLALLTAHGEPFFWAAIDRDGAIEAAENALRAILRSSPYARMGLAVAGRSDQRAMRRRSDGEFEYIPEIEPYTPPALGRSLIRAGRKKKVRVLEPLSSGVETLLFEAHSHIRDIDGLVADEALDELCKVIFTKFFDETHTAPDSPYLMQTALYGCSEELAAEVRRLYDDAIRDHSDGELRSGAFNSPILLSSPALSRVVEELQQYSLADSGIDVKGRAFQMVLAPAVRAGMGQYFTPHQVIDLVVGVVAPDTHERVLDPFAGSAHFLARSLERIKSQRLSDEIAALRRWARTHLHAIEKSERMVRVAMTDMLLHGDGHSNLYCTDSLLDFANYRSLQPESFDVIMTNPPFGSLLHREAIGRLGRFDLSRDRNTIPLEILGLERCMQFLKPGGRLAIVLPDGVLANRNTEYVRSWLCNRMKIRAIVSLPIETFSPFGANVKTSVVFGRKLTPDERVGEYDVFLCRIDNIGYDPSGRPRDGSEVMAATQAIRAFLTNEGW